MKSSANRVIRPVGFDFSDNSEILIEKCLVSRKRLESVDSYVIKSLAAVVFRR